MDGQVVIEDYIRRLKQLGFGGMLVSDHNSYDGYRQWKNSIRGKRHRDFVVLKGVEYDTIDCGHILVIMPEGVKLRILEMRGLPVHLLVKIVHRYGGILGPAHPCGERYMSFATTRMRQGKPVRTMRRRGGWRSDITSLVSEAAIRIRRIISEWHTRNFRTGSGRSRI